MHKRINIKLLLLPIFVIVALIVVSFIFSSKIQVLKKQIDNIYFGNFVPIHKLHSIKESYIQIIPRRYLIEKEQDNIVKNWEYYSSQYKSVDERKIINQIGEKLMLGLKTHTTKDIKKSLADIDYLINYEIKSAYLQRKAFLERYDDMQNYLFFIQALIVFLVLLVTALIIYTHLKYTDRLEVLNEKYKVEANTDALTQLYNRKYFNSIFDELMNISKEHNFNSVFIMIDIDFFKQYNDTYGHDAGDIALKKVAFVLDELFNKEYEYTFRLGGEEFAIIIFDTNLNYVKFMMEKLKDYISSLKIEHSASATQFLTLSLGIVMIDESQYDSIPREIYNLADKKLYHSKENGRNQYTI